MSETLSGPAIISTTITSLGLMLNFLYQNRRERRFMNLQDEKILSETRAATRAEGETIRKELRDTVNEQKKYIRQLETDVRESEKREDLLEGQMRAIQAKLVQTEERLAQAVTDLATQKERCRYLEERVDRMMRGDQS